LFGKTLRAEQRSKVKLTRKKDGTGFVAIKIFTRQALRFLIYQEVSILRKLAHTNIVRLHEMVEAERRLALDFGFLSGGTLDE
jgi:protein-serine/threonine kinase